MAGASLFTIHFRALDLHVMGQPILGAQARHHRDPRHAVAAATVLRAKEFFNHGGDAVAPQELARILGETIDFARQGQLEAERAAKKK